MGVLRDNKAILKKLEKQMQFFETVSIVGDIRHLCVMNWFIYNKRIHTSYIGVKLTIPNTAFTWVEDEDTLYYCVDLRKVLSYNNIKWYIVANILENDLGTALEYDIDTWVDFLFNNSLDLSLEDIVAFINAMGIPYEMKTFHDLQMDSSIKERLINIVSKIVSSKLDEYIESCLDIKNVYRSQESLNGQGSLKYLFYKNGCLAVARVDIADNRVVFPNYGSLSACSLNKDVKKKDSVIYYSISDVMNKGYTSNSGKELILPIETNKNMRVDLTNGGRCWAETRM